MQSVRGIESLGSQPARLALPLFNSFPLTELQFPHLYNGTYETQQRLEEIKQKYEAFIRPAGL